MHPRFWSLFFFGADQSVKGSPVRCQFKECHHHQISARPKRQPVEFPTNLQRLTTWEWDSITNSVTHFTSFATDCWFDVLGRRSWWQNTVCACMKIRELTSADSSSGFVLFWTKSPQTGQCRKVLHCRLHQMFRIYHQPTSLRSTAVGSRDGGSLSEEQVDGADDAQTVWSHWMASEEHLRYHVLVS